MDILSIQCNEREYTTFDLNQMPDRSYYSLLVHATDCLVLGFGISICLIQTIKRRVVPKHRKKGTFSLIWIKLCPNGAHKFICQYYLFLGLRIDVLFPKYQRKNIFLLIWIKFLLVFIVPSLYTQKIVLIDPVDSVNSIQIVTSTVWYY